MKLVLAGGSGFIGGEILSRCLLTDGVTEVILLSRRALPHLSARDSRIKVLVLVDFLVYPPEVVEEFQGVRACLW